MTSPLELIGAVAGSVLGIAAIGALFVRLVALPYLKEHLIGPLLHQLSDMQAKDAELAVAYRVAAAMFEGHMHSSEDDRRHIWEAINDLRRGTYERRNP